MDEDKLVGVMTTEVAPDLIRVVTLSGINEIVVLCAKVLKSWANEIGKSRVQLIGRIGWLKHKGLKEIGAKPKWIVMEV